MIDKTGFWASDDAHIHHVRSIPLEKWILNFFNKVDINKKDRIWDLGCGLGYYLKELSENGFTGCVGVEADPPKQKVFNLIYRHNLTTPMMSVQKGNVICLEVLEHIPKELESRVIKNINHCCDNFLILSWAVEGQPGYGHVNCKNNPEVISLFEKEGYILLEEDTLDARSVIDDTTPWFKNTILIFKKI